MPKQTVFLLAAYVGEIGSRSISLYHFSAIDYCCYATSLSWAACNLAGYNVHVRNCWYVSTYLVRITMIVGAQVCDCRKVSRQQQCTVHPKAELTTEGSWTFLWNLPHSHGPWKPTLLNSSKDSEKIGNEYERERDGMKVLKLTCSHEKTNDKEWR